VLPAKAGPGAQAPQDEGNPPGAHWPRNSQSPDVRRWDVTSTVDAASAAKPISGMGGVVNTSLVALCLKNLRKGGAMHIVPNTRQEDDPHGLKAVAELLDHGKDDDFEQKVSNRLPEIQRVKKLLTRVQELSPGIEFSPYVMRMINVADKHESARLAEVA